MVSLKWIATRLKTGNMDQRLRENLMNKEEIRQSLADVLVRETALLDVPAEADWLSLEERFETRFPAEFKAFIDLMSEFAFPGDIYNVPQKGRSNGNDTITQIFESERANSDWPEYLVPFYGIGNGDYFVLDTRERDSSAVYFRNHADGGIVRYSDNFGVWIKKLPAFLNGEE